MYDVKCMKKQLLIIGLCGESVFMGVDHFHKPEETLHAYSIYIEPGGKGFNQAVMAARNGVDVFFAGAVGSDPYADECMNVLNNERIRSKCFKKDGKHTAYACIMTDKCGDNRVTVYPGASELLSKEDIDSIEAVFAQSRYVLLTPEIPEEAFDESVCLAKYYSVPIIINPAPYKSWIQKYLQSAYCITPNRAEAMSLFGSIDRDVLKNKCPSENLVITLGSKGALCLHEGLFTEIPAPELHPVDTTGAGDCFNGVLAAELIKGSGFIDSARCAVHAASLSTLHPHVL